MALQNAHRCSEYEKATSAILLARCRTWYRSNVCFVHRRRFRSRQQAAPFDRTEWQSPSPTALRCTKHVRSASCERERASITRRSLFAHQHERTTRESARCCQRTTIRQLAAPRCSTPPSSASASNHGHIVRCNYTVPPYRHQASLGVLANIAPATLGRTTEQLHVRDRRVLDNHQHRHA